MEVTHTIYLCLKELGYASGLLEPTTHLEDDLGIDSLERVELAILVCGQLGLAPHVVPDVRNASTVGELAARIEPLVGSDRAGSEGHG